VARSPAATTSAAGANSGTSRTGDAAGGAGSGGSNYDVRAGDTLSSIAARSYPGTDRSTRERALVAIFRANASAFDGNMNVLRAGSRLQLPGDAELAAISPGEAGAEVRRQYLAWTSARAASGGASSVATGAGQLRLVPPQESAAAPGAGTAGGSANAGAGGAAAAAAAANAGLQQRVQQLEQDLAASRRLLDARNADLARLQAQLARAPAGAQAPAAAQPQVATEPPAASPATVAPAAAPTPPTPAPPAPAAAAPKPAAPPSNGSVLDLLVEYWYVPVGLVAVLLALLGLRVVRARKEEEFDRSLNRLGSIGFTRTSADSGSRATDTVPVRTLAQPKEQSFLVEESGSHEQPRFDSSGRAAVTGEHVVIDDSVTSEAPVALDQGDPLAEADFHMAYGLYDQAADLVQIAISREPSRRELKLKLLEVFFVWGNKDRFLQSAHELAATREQALPGEWEKTLIMGRQIAPEDALFAGGDALRGAASGGVDLNLEGGQNRVDFDLLGEPSVGSTVEGVELDLNAALGDNETTGEAGAIGGTSVDFVLDDPERGNEATGSTREMLGAPPAGDTATVQVSTSDADAPTVEQQQLRHGDNETIRQKLGAPARQTSADQTAELALDDLGLDLGSLDATGEPPVLGGEDQPTTLTDMDEETRRILASTEAEQHEQGQSAAKTQSMPAPTDASGTWLFSDSDFAAIAKQGTEGDSPTELVTQIRPRVPDDNPTSQLAALDSTGLDLDFGGLDAPKEAANGGVDLDVGPAVPSAEGTFVQTQRITSLESPLPDLEPATMSEVGTKLDLARAYMDMGDPDGARSILQEVLQEGSVSQKQEARRLIEALPG
jgi:pilus assembly protein FimV